MRFDFDDDGKVEFIEFLGGIDGKLQPTIYGVSVFQSKADTLYNILSDENHGEIDDSGNGYSYGFLNISVGVFRPNIPKDEMKKANYWATIGIGTADYYR